MIENYGNLPKSYKILWAVLRTVIILWGIFGLLHGSVVEFLEAIFAVIFTHLWDFFQIFGTRSFIIEITPETATGLNIFIFVAVCIGSTVTNRTDFEHIDILTHFVAGLISAYFGYDLANIIFRKRGYLGPAVSSFFAICFAQFISVGWEIYEFTMDSIYGLNLQRRETGVLDTMTDFCVCAAGSVLGMLLVSFLRNGIIGKNKDKIREENRKKEEIRLLKDKLYEEYLKGEGND
ncbi:MAG: hypothetical protein J1F37_06615 [Oscillospiraceae bacterium]|nr:hypothetical protein [Oscillospiraceae bacterium]